MRETFLILVLLALYGSFGAMLYMEWVVRSIGYPIFTNHEIEVCLLALVMLTLGVGSAVKHKIRK